MSEALLEAVALTRGFQSGTRRIEVLRALDFNAAEAEAVAVTGDSGVGKSTLLHLLGGLDRPDAGAVRFRGESIFLRGERQLADYRNRNVGFIFQFHHLLPEFTALENAEMPFRIAGFGNTRRQAARELLGRLGLGHRLDHRPGELSGGEQQRVAIARAVLAAPRVVLADEPIGNLDPATGTEVFALLRELQRERGFALVVATHSERLARGCDRILRLKDGQLHSLDAAGIADFFSGAAR